MNCIISNPYVKIIVINYVFGRSIMNIFLLFNSFFVSNVIVKITSVLFMLKKEKSKQNKNISDRLVKWLLIVAGSFFLVIGTIGIFIPILPTTPFLLLAAACYARSSKRFYNWLINNKLFGSYIKNYREGKGIPIKVKIYTVSLLWLTILFSVFFVIEILWARVILIIIAVGVSFHVLTIKTYKQKKK